MPSQITHQLFAEDVLREVFGEDRYTKNNAIISFAAQGPDIFYHNQRTKPFAYAYGRAIHKKNYGRLIMNMVSLCRRYSSPRRETMRAFITGFTTHAIVDRETHPYIIYRAGWVEPFNPESRKYQRTHPFLERIIDVLLLKELRGMTVSEYDYAGRFSIKKLPEDIVDVAVEAIRTTYPSGKNNRITKTSFENAVADTLFFIRMTDPHAANNIIEAFKREKRKESSPRVLALFYPDVLPQRIDFLNLGKEMWVDPCEPSVKTDDSFIDRYNSALSKAVPLAEKINSAIDGSINITEIEQAVGNTNLSDGRSTAGCTPRASDPFPLQDILEEIYRKIESVTGGGTL